MSFYFNSLSTPSRVVNLVPFFKVVTFILSSMILESDNNTSFFSFFDVTQKVSIVVGMVLFGTIDQITGSMRNSMLFFMIFFAIGAFLLIKLHKKIKA